MSVLRITITVAVDDKVLALTPYTKTISPSTYAQFDQDSDDEILLFGGTSGTLRALAMRVFNQPAEIVIGGIAATTLPQLLDGGVVIGTFNALYSTTSGCKAVPTTTDALRVKGVVCPT